MDLAASAGLGCSAFGAGACSTPAIRLWGYESHLLGVHQHQQPHTFACLSASHTQGLSSSSGAGHQECFKTGCRHRSGALALHRKLGARIMCAEYAPMYLGWRQVQACWETW